MRSLKDDNYQFHNMFKFASLHTKSIDINSSIMRRRVMKPIFDLEAKLLSIPISFSQLNNDSLILIFYK